MMILGSLSLDSKKVVFKIYTNEVPSGPHCNISVNTNDGKYVLQNNSIDSDVVQCI